MSNWGIIAPDKNLGQSRKPILDPGTESVGTVTCDINNTGTSTFWKINPRMPSPAITNIQVKVTVASRHSHVLEGHGRDE